jgi:hypothetical protein
MDQTTWTDQIDPATGNPVAWWNNPAMAYHKGLDDGARLGYQRAMAEIFEIFRTTIGAVGETSVKEAMRRQIAASEAIARSREWDRTASQPRPGDFLGRNAA